jgi:hypothetical protein
LRVLTIAAVLAACLCSGACLPEPFRGSDVVLEVGTQAGPDITNRSTEHYELFATINQGVVSIGKFRVDAELVAWEHPGTEKIGVANRQPAGGLPQSGIRFTTDVNLADAEEVFLTIEQNGETDLSPSEKVIGRGVLMDGRRSVLVADLEGEVPVLGATVPLVGSRVAVVLGEGEVD